MAMTTDTQGSEAMDQFTTRFKPSELARFKEVASMETAKLCYGVTVSDLIRKWSLAGLKDYEKRNGIETKEKK